MKLLWILLGRLAAVVSWPLVWLVIRFTRRSRVLIVSGDEILLLKGWLSLGRWGLPGGGIKKGEMPTTAAVREVMEETGIMLDHNQLRSMGTLRQTKLYPYRIQAFVTEFKSKPELHIRGVEIVDAIWAKQSDIEKLGAEQHVNMLLTAWQKQR